MTLRPLLWTNGPAPGLLFWPNPPDSLTSDGRKGQWLHHRQWQHPSILDYQIKADRLQGYDYVGYHGYAKRRYSEIVGVDLEVLCRNVTEPRNSTCSWRGYEDIEVKFMQKIEKGPIFASTIAFLESRNYQTYNINFREDGKKQTDITD